MPEAQLIRNSFEITSNQFKNANTLELASPPNSPVIDFIKGFLLTLADGSCKERLAEGTGSSVAKSTSG